MDNVTTTRNGYEAEMGFAIVTAHFYIYTTTDTITQSMPPMPRESLDKHNPNVVGSCETQNVKVGKAER